MMRNYLIGLIIFCIILFFGLISRDIRIDNLENRIDFLEETQLEILNMVLYGTD